MAIYLERIISLLIRILVIMYPLVTFVGCPASFLICMIEREVDVAWNECRENGKRLSP